MQAVRQRDTAVELRIRKLIYSQGIRYRVHCRPLPDLNRRADLVFKAQRVAVFVHGCFWHSCPRHKSKPKTNREWWARKLEGNVKRDRETVRILQRAGWRVVIAWEHESPLKAARRIMAAVGVRGGREITRRVIEKLAVVV